MFEHLIFFPVHAKCCPDSFPMCYALMLHGLHDFRGHDNLTCRVYTGQAFKHPLEAVPRHVMRAAMMLLQSFTRVLSSASIIQNKGAPIVLYPLVLGAQVVHVAMPGDEPSIDDLEVTDDVRLLAPQLTSASGSSPATESERRAYFSKDANRQVGACHAKTFRPSMCASSDST